MSIRISRDLLSRIGRHGEDTYPEECCGFLLGTADGEAKHVIDLMAAENDASETRERRFLITPRAYLRAERAARAKSLDIVGFYHSHPDHPARPSQYDLDHAWPVLSYIIVSIPGGRAGDLFSWVLRSDRSAFDEEPMSHA